MTDFELVMMYAFRYCLGRQTSAPLTFTSFIMENDNFNKLTNVSKNVMIKEINEAMNMNRINDVDKTTWMTFKQYLEMNV